MSYAAWKKNVVITYPNAIDKGPEPEHIWSFFMYALFVIGVVIAPGTKNLEGLFISAASLTMLGYLKILQYLQYLSQRTYQEGLRGSNYRVTAAYVDRAGIQSFEMTYLAYCPTLGIETYDTLSNAERDLKVGIHKGLYARFGKTKGVLCNGTIKITKIEYLGPRPV